MTADVSAAGECDLSNSGERSGTPAACPPSPAATSKDEAAAAGGQAPDRKGDGAELQVGGRVDSRGGGWCGSQYTGSWTLLLV